MTEERSMFWAGWGLATGVITALIMIVVLWMVFMPRYNVYSSKMDGEAVLAHAHAARMVLVTQAEAELEAAHKRADAIKIVGEMAKLYPEYRQQEFIGAFGEALKEGKITQIIYVPTEANIPLLEADGRRHNPRQ